MRPRASPRGVRLAPREGQLRGSHCRYCRAGYGKAHYAANRELYKERARAQKQRWRFERTRLLFDYFAAHPCRDCGETDPVVLDLDHLRDKRLNIGNELTHRRWSAILEEIAKCDVVCANCHRRRTAKRLGSMRAVLSELASPPVEASAPDG